MGKIIRLSWINLKKHIGEAVSLAVLIAACVALVSGSFSARHSIENIFTEVMEKTNCYENIILVSDSGFDERILNYFEENEDVTRYDTFNISGGIETKYINSLGDETSQSMYFTDAENEEKYERFNIETTLSGEEINELEHPVFMPFAARDILGCRINRNFDVVVGNKKYSFTVAGFYESGFFSDPTLGMKLIVSESDYITMNSVLTKYKAIVFDAAVPDKGEDIIADFISTCENEYKFDSLQINTAIDYSLMRMYCAQISKTILVVMLYMSVVIIVAVAVMIRYRIRSDIEKQIVSIGVLEAIGYKWREISLSYVFEYLIISLTGIFFGTGVGMILAKLLFMMGKLLSGHYCPSEMYFVPFVICAAAVLALVGIIAYLRAGMLKKYPPVTAMRRGTGDHHFSRNILPLRNTGKSVHLRFAGREFIGNIRQSGGIALCMVISTAAIVLCFVMHSYFGKDMNVIRSVLGIEISDFHLELNSGIDAELFAEEISGIEGVRKVTPSASQLIQVKGFDEIHLLPQVFSSFELTENIFPDKGRFPEHDNEVMINSIAADVEKVRVGDTITIEYNRVKRNYIICGTVASVGNGGQNLYITEAGMKRMDPSYRQTAVDVYLDDDADTKAVKKEILSRFGRGISDQENEEGEKASYEDRIRAEADKKIAEILGAYGADHVEYAIVSDGKMITGSSSDFAVSSVVEIGSIVKTQTDGTSMAIGAVTVLFMIIAAVIDMIILQMIIRAGIRRNYRKFGIMKSLGYTSRELMFQLAAGIMPAVLISVLSGTGIGVLLIGMARSNLGKIQLNMVSVFVLDLVIMLFCFLCAYIGARRVKKISVCELVSE